MPKSIAVALLPMKPGEAPDGITGIAINHELLEQPHWELRLVPSATMWADVVDGLSVLLADRFHKALLRVLLPYQPPHVVLRTDGGLHSLDGTPLADDFAAIARVLRVDVRMKYSAQVGAYTRILDGAELGEPLPDGHLLRAPHGRVVLGPQLDFDE